MYSIQYTVYTELGTTTTTLTLQRNQYSARLSLFSLFNPILHHDLNCMLIIPSPLPINPPLVYPSFRFIMPIQFRFVLAVSAPQLQWCHRYSEQPLGEPSPPPCAVFVKTIIFLCAFVFLLSTEPRK